MAITGYVVFTDKTQVRFTSLIYDSPEPVAQGNILNNFGPDDLLINIARFCFGANMSTTSKYRTMLRC